MDYTGSPEHFSEMGSYITCEPHKLFKCQILLTLYASTTVGMSITIAYFAAGPGASSDWAGQFTPLGIAIPTVMGCRVFRELKLGIIQDAMTMPDSLTVSSAVFASEPQHEHAWTVGGSSDSASELELTDIGTKCSGARSNNQV